MDAKRIHLSKIFKIMERKESDGRPKEFSIRYVKVSTGERVDYSKAILTSIHTAGDTVNIMKVGEIHPRKIKRVLIVRFNGLKVYI
jgi:hypothetical protein